MNPAGSVLTYSVAILQRVCAGAADIVLDQHLRYSHCSVRIILLCQSARAAEGRARAVIRNHDSERDRSGV